MLSRIVLDECSAVRGSGDDLRSFFFQLSNALNSAPRNCFGRTVGARLVAKYGGDPSQRYRLTLRVIAVGDGTQ